MPEISTETVNNNGSAVFFPGALGGDGESGNVPIDTTGIDGYFIHKIGTQLLSGSTLSISNAFRVAAEYSVYTSRYLADPGDAMFNESGRFIYRTNTLRGRVFKAVLLPSGYRTNDLTAGQIKKLSENYYSRMSKYQLILLRAANAINVAGNLGAIYYCVGGDKDCSVQEYTTFASYAAADGAFYVGGHFQYNGSQLVGSDPQNAYRSFNFARKSFIVMNIVEIVGGSTKVGIEIYNSVAEPDKFSMSSLVDGGLRIGTGSSWLVYNSYMAREAAKLAGSSATIGKAIDILRAHAIVLPPKILWAIRGTGAIGPLISSGVSISDIYSGVTDDSLTSEKSTHKIVSGSLGIASSLCFLGFAFFVTPASIPIGVVFFSAGLGLLGVQTTYDEWDDIKALYNSKMSVEVKKWPKMM